MKGGNNGVWDATEYMQNLSLLDDHIGIPMAEQLHCPMFTQNKIEYIHALGEDAIPTLFVALSNFHHHEKGSLSTDLLYSNKSGIFCWKKTSEIVEELRRRGYGEDQKWVIKFPFKTHSFGLKWCENYEKLETEISKSFYDDFTGLNIPYAIVQPKLKNRFEYKVTLIDGKALHYFSEKKGKAFLYGEEVNVLFPFAESVLRKLKMMRSGTMDKGLVRVDIMSNDDGRPVVNEFESLEAKNTKDDIKVQEGLRNYYLDHLRRLATFI